MAVQFRERNVLLQRLRQVAGGNHKPVQIMERQVHNDDHSDIPEIVLLSDEDVPSDCALYAIVLGGRRIGYIVIGPDGQEFVTTDLGAAIAFAKEVTRERRLGR